MYTHLSVCVMSEEQKKKKSLGGRIEAVGDTMEFGMRAIFGLVFAGFFAMAGWWLGGHIWVGVSIVFACSAFPVGFLIGFFWMEVKLLLKLFLGGIFGGGN